MKMKHLWIPFGIAFVTVLSLKLFQIIYLIDPVTGLNSQFDYIYYIILATVLVLFVVIMLMCRSCREVRSKYCVSRNIPAGIFSFIAGVALIIYFIYNMVNSLPEMQTLSSKSTIVISDVIIGIVFIALSFSSFLGKNLFRKLPAITLLPAIWICIRLLILTFVDYTNVTLVSTNALLALALICLLLFFFLYSKLLSALQAERTFKRCLMTALMAILTAMLYAVPEFVSIFYISTTTPLIDKLPNFTDFMLALYVFSLAIEMTIMIDRPNINENIDIDDDKFEKYVAIRAAEAETKRKMQTETFRGIDRAEIPQKLYSEKPKNNKKVEPEFETAVEYEMPKKIIDDKQKNNNETVNMDEIDKMVNEILNEDR